MKQILLLFFIGSFSCFAQISFVNYTTKDGLSSNQVYDIHQDKNGIIWFATDRGISSFNGSFFTNYSTLDGLLSDVVLDFFPQEDGTIWCSTEKRKLFIFDPLKQTFKSFKYNHLIHEVTFGEIKALHIDKGDCYIRFMNTTGYQKITSNGKSAAIQLKSIDERTQPRYYLIQLKKDFYFYSTSNKGAINDTKLVGAHRDLVVNNGNYTARLCYDSFDIIDKSKKVNSFQLLKNETLLQLGKIDDLFWVSGYTIGITLFNNNGEVQKSYLTDLPCSKIIKDKENGIWISTLSNGVYYSPTSRINLLEHSQNSFITSLSISGQNVAYGTNGGRVVEYSFLDGKYNERIARHGGAVRFYQGKLFSNALNQGSDPFIHYIRRFSENQSKPLLYVSSITFHEGFTIKHTLNYTERLYDSDFINSNFLISQGTCVKIINQNKQVVDSVDLKTITNDLDFVGGKIYCGTSTRGLLILDSKLNIVDSVNLKSGLKSNYVNDVKIAFGSVWLATRNGISRIQNIGTKKQVISTISVSNGLNDKEVNDFDFMGDTIFVGTRLGINYFRITNWDKIVESKPSIFFTIKKISYQGSEITKTLGLPYYKNDLTFEIEFANFKLNKEITSVRYNFLAKRDFL